MANVMVLIEDSYFGVICPHSHSVSVRWPCGGFVEFSLGDRPNFPRMCRDCPMCGSTLQSYTEQSCWPWSSGQGGGPVVRVVGQWSRWCPDHHGPVVSVVVVQWFIFFFFFFFFDSLFWQGIALTCPVFIPSHSIPMSIYIKISFVNNTNPTSISLLLKRAPPLVQ